MGGAPGDHPAAPNDDRGRMAAAHGGHRCVAAAMDDHGHAVTTAIATACAGSGESRRRRGLVAVRATAPPPRSAARPTGRRRRQRVGGPAGWAAVLAAVGVAAVSSSTTGVAGAVTGAAGAGAGPGAPRPTGTGLVRQETNGAVPSNFCSAAPVDPTAAQAVASAEAVWSAQPNRTLCNVLVSAQADDGFILYVDGVRLMASDDWQKTRSENFLAGPGSVVSVTACNVGGSPVDDQAYAKIVVSFQGQRQISDGAWKATDERPPGADASVWTAPDFDDSGWTPATLPVLMGKVAPLLGPAGAMGIWAATKTASQRVYLRSPPLPDDFCGPPGDPPPPSRPGGRNTATPGADNGDGGLPVWGIVLAALAVVAIVGLVIIGASYLWCWPWGAGVYRVDQWHLFPPGQDGAAALNEEEQRRVAAAGVGGVVATDSSGADSEARGATAAAPPVGAATAVLPVADVVDDESLSDVVAAKVAAVAGDKIVGYEQFQASLGGLGTESSLSSPTYSAEAVGDGISRLPTDGSRAPWFTA